MNVLDLEDGGSVHPVRKNDARVTPLGRTLRATSIDELPQFFNCCAVKCHWSGRVRMPAPHDDGYTRLIGNYAFRHHIKAGITGWLKLVDSAGRQPIWTS